MKPFARLAIAGISGVALYKAFTTVLGPLLIFVLGLLWAGLKLALIAAVVYFLYSLFRKRDGTPEVEVGDIRDEGPIEVDIEIDDFTE